MRYFNEVWFWRWSNSAERWKACSTPLGKDLVQYDPARKKLIFIGHWDWNRCAVRSIPAPMKIRFNHEGKRTTIIANITRVIYGQEKADKTVCVYFEALSPCRSNHNSDGDE